MPEEQVFDDGSEVEYEAPVDDPPSGEYVDSHDVIADALRDPDQVAAGEFLGLAIDPDDDTDNGSQWGTPENPTMTQEDFEALS